MWHVTQDTWHMTHDMLHMVGGEHSLNISAAQLLRLGIDSVFQILKDRITDWSNEWINYEGDCKTAPATPVLLNKLIASL